MAFDKPKTEAPRRKQENIDPYTAKIPKTKSKQRREQDLKHAVRHRDYDALEDYDEEGY